MTISDVDNERPCWATTSLVHHCRQRFKRGWHDLPDGAARRWLVDTVIGFVLSAAITVGMTLGVKAWADGTSFAWEPETMQWLGRVVPLSAARWMGVLGNSLWTWPLMVFAAGMSAWYKKPLQALSLFPGYLITQVIVSIGWLLWNRPAPGLITQEPAHAVFNAFPSGHTAHAIFAFGMLSYLWWTAARRPTERLVALLVFLVLAGAVSCGRVASGAHWPTDILSAWTVGLMWLCVLVIALRSPEG